ncbi:unnamed protein product [Effrenium voratum]|uniref:Uncharacterized protein n=1 Tax=Effrenium voratum TaxID=2562239 RepID=A0AA36IBB5_9DINO|nr:unnamed protein product [Effrenium voratum]
MLQGLAGVEAATLASWLVLDACTGRLARVRPREDGSQDSWVLGYGFSYIYRRAAALAQPFQHEHFGEDYAFMVALQHTHGRQSVRAVHDEEGVVLHVQQGLNLSNSHAEEELAPAALRHTALGEAEVAIASGSLQLESPFISVGSGYSLYLRPPPYLPLEAMRAALKESGVAGSIWRSEGSDEDVLISYRVRRAGEVFAEPGRAFRVLPRFSASARLPADVPRTARPEQLALRHVARQLLARCPPQRPAFAQFRGWIRLCAGQCSHMALLATLRIMSNLFPQVRMEVWIQSEEQRGSSTGA